MCSAKRNVLNTKSLSCEASTVPGKEFCCRTLEMFLLKVADLFSARTAQQFRDSEENDILLLQCGTILARSIERLPQGSCYRTPLRKLYLSSIANDEPYSKGRFPSLYRTELLRFVTTYSLLDPSSALVVQERVCCAVQSAKQWYRDEEAGGLFDTSGSRFPRSELYAFLVLLVDLWQSFGNRSARDLLRLMVDGLLQMDEYHRICRKHRLPGILAVLSDSFVVMAEDILLQHLFRSNYLASTLRDDAWRMFEQALLFLSVRFEPTLFRFISVLLQKQIENVYRAFRFVSPAELVQRNIALATVLLSYERCCKLSCNSSLQTVASSANFLFDIKAVVSAIQGEMLFRETPPAHFSTATYLSTRVQPGSLFIEPDQNWSKKYRVMSVDYAEIFSKGAAMVLTSNLPDPLAAGQPTIRVKNTFSAMLKLALLRRCQYQGKVIGITGSVGKTSTATMLHDILGFFGGSYINIPHFNHQMGVPLTIVNIPLQSPYAVVEMGMGRPQTILPKTILAKPHIAVVVDIQHDHMEFHDSINSVIETKMEILEGISPGGKIVLNRDSIHFPAMLGIVRQKDTVDLITFGEHPEADVWARSIIPGPASSEIEVEIAGKSYRYCLSLPGKHMALNSLAVCAVLHGLDLRLDKALEHFRSLKPVRGRNEIFRVVLKNGSTVQVVNDSFNANPASMRSSFHLLSLIEPEEKGRRVMVLGDMGELGPASRKYHEELADDINRSRIDMVYSVGHFTRFLDSRISSGIIHRHFSSPEELQTDLLQSIRAGDVVAFKGSARDDAMQKIISSLREKILNPPDED